MGLEPFRRLNATYGWGWKEDTSGMYHFGHVVQMHAQSFSDDVTRIQVYCQHTSTIISRSKISLRHRLSAREMLRVAEEGNTKLFDRLEIVILLSEDDA